MTDPSAILGLHHVQVAAPPGRESDARRFYVELVGLDEIPKPAGLAARGGIWLRCGSHELHVGVEADFRPAKKAHPALHVRDVATLDALRRSLVAAGVPVRDDPESAPGLERFFADDPFGNRLELVANR